MPLFPIDRKVLLAGVSTPVYVNSVPAKSVLVGNATPGDLRVYYRENDEATYVVIAPGYERPFDVQFSGRDGAIFWLKSDLDGTVVIVWTNR